MMVGLQVLVVVAGVQAAVGALLSDELRRSWPGLEVLDEIVDPSGPLADKGLVLYVPQTPGLAEAVSALTKLRAKPVVMVHLGSSFNGKQWVEGQPMEVLGGGHLVHVVVFVDDPRPFLSEVAKDLRWNPKFLLLLNLGRDDARQILTDTAISHVQRCVLLQVLTGRLTEVVEALIYYPFSTTTKIRSLGSWKVGMGKTKPILGMNNSVHHDISKGRHTTNWVEGELFMDRFPAFEGYKFLLGTWFDDYPYLHQSQTGPDGEGDGVMIEMLDAMGSVLNFTYHVTSEPPDLQWGNYENGSWTGMLGMVHRRDKNFTVNYFGFTNERIRDFDASVSYWMEGFGLSLLTPPPLPKWRSIYYPFMPLVWAAVSATFALAIIAMILQGHIAGEGVGKWLSGSWSYLVRPMVSNSLPRLPTAQWQRVFLATWILGCLILTTAYTANLIAFLTIPVFPERIQTVQQLAESNYRVSMYDYGEFVPGALKSSQDPYYRTLGDRLDLYPTTETSVYPLTNGTHAYIESYSYTVVLLYVVHKAYNAYMLREQLYPNHMCWYFQKNTPWKYKLDHGIQRLVEAGLIAQWLKIKTADFLGLNYELKQRLASRERQAIAALSLEHVQGVFFLFLLGIVTAFIIFLVEVMAKTA